MTKFRLEPKYLNMWLHQNHAEYIGDFIPGVLLDSFSVATPRGIAAIYDTYVNPNQSTYTIVFGSYKSGEFDKVNADFIKRMEEYEREYDAI